ncbi:MAG TPA: Rrf2 family transcriptional regulator [Ignavibacteria bacterium]|nr:Rrf2 family transcriptional regulator [Ignavibacteria bacterium]
MIRLSKKVEYSIIALKYFAISKETYLTAKEISNKYKIPHELLAKILQRLSKEKILTSNQGINGGYKLNKQPSDISLEYIIKLFDGEKGIVECINGKSAGECCIFDECTIKDPIIKLQKELEIYFSSKKISDFV